jgi:hypothetical protein
MTSRSGVNDFSPLRTVLDFILERSRRGKRHRAQSGEVSVTSGAPYGYRYVRKTDEAPPRIPCLRPRPVW